MEIRQGKAGYASAVSPEVAQVLNRRAIGFDEFLRGHLHPFGEASGGAAAR
ncbi:MAG TPA: hypothetical protein VM709_10545 [Candidatus Sulfotelmatobacter sp.]|nr:hypothetical protein [Candidatus Sulfotelmatobacter sp.]